jgi:hypothetical protein
MKTSVENTSLCLGAMDLRSIYGEGNDGLNFKSHEVTEILQTLEKSDENGYKVIKLAITSDEVHGNNHDGLEQKEELIILKKNDK